MRADERTHFLFFKEGCGGRCSVIHADSYFVLRIEESYIVQHTKLKKRKLAIWSEILLQKAALFFTTRKGEEGGVLQRVCLHSTWSNTALHFDEWIVFLRHRNNLKPNEKKLSFWTKYEWIVVNLLALFAVLKFVESEQGQILL
jgi:hypothetical protein